MTALILVDLQNDFMPGGALPVSEGDKIIPVINQLLKLPFTLVVATKDWHPAMHGSFATTHQKKPGERISLSGIDQILWPDHCVQNTKGADFYPGWETSKVDKIFYKGTDKNIDSYSTFFDNGHLRNTGLDEYLKAKGIHKLYFAGLATDYCVKYSVIHALELGYKTFVVEDGCKGINLQPNDVQNAIDTMQAAGAKVVDSKSISRGGGI